MAAVVDLLRPFATLGELGRGLAPGHGDRSCVLAMAIADRMGAGDEDRAATLATSLLFHAGCTAGASQFAAFIAADELLAQHDLWICDPDNLTDVLSWARKNVGVGAPLPIRVARLIQVIGQGEGAFGDFMKGCYDVGMRVAARLGMSPYVQRSMRHVCETWHGKGPLKVAGEAIPLPTRIVQTATLAEVFATDSGPERARAAVKRRAGKSIDPAVAKAFADVAGSDSFWEELRGPLAHRVIELGRPVGEADDSAVDELVRSLADVVDLKSPATATHSRTAGRLAEGVAQEMGLSGEETRLATRAAWVHDVGKVGVTCSVLEKKAHRTRFEEECLALHVALSERIVGSSEALAELRPIVATHHERENGAGGSTERRPALRVVAAVDAYLEDRDARTGPPSERSADALRAVRSQGLDAASLDALESVLTRSGGRRAPKGPADLSEREQEILALLARGLTNKEIANELHVSPHTVRHHLEHVYEKIDVISRAGATLFAAEHGYA